MSTLEGAATQESRGGRVLLIDDDERHLAMLTQTLRVRGYEVYTSTHPERAVDAYRAHRAEVVVVDLTMPELDGLEVLARLRQHDAAAAVVLLSAYVDVPTTVKALRLGADDVLTKPVEVPLLVASMARSMERVREVRLQRAVMMQGEEAAVFLDGSPLMQRLHRALQQAALGDYTLLIRGERGTGKGAAAQLVHRLSSRSAAPFLRVACGESSTEQLVVDLFGRDHAQERSPTTSDLCARAAGGTLFLDDVGALPGDLQLSLVRIVEGKARAFESAVPTGVRIISSATTSLEDLVDRGTFRRDLHRCLAEIPITIPALRTRGADAIGSLGTQLLQLHQARVGRGPTRFTDDALSLLGAYAWPGNVRELRNAIEDGFPFALDDTEFAAAHLPPPICDAANGANADTAAATDGDGRTLEALERRYIARVLSQVGGNRSQAARILGISRGTLYNKMTAYGLERIARD